jgi:hypothetical protein
MSSGYAAVHAQAQLRVVKPGASSPACPRGMNSFVTATQASIQKGERGQMHVNMVKPPHNNKTQLTPENDNAQTHTQHALLCLQRAAAAHLAQCCLHHHHHVTQSSHSINAI